MAVIRKPPARPRKIIPPVSKELLKEKGCDLTLWIQTNCPNDQELGILLDRWGVQVDLLADFCRGRAAIDSDTLYLIAHDTQLGVKRILTQSMDKRLQWLKELRGPVWKKSII